MPEPNESSWFPLCRADNTCITGSTFILSAWTTTAITVTSDIRQYTTAYSFWPYDTTWEEPDRQAGVPRVTANDRAKELFLASITPEQRAEFERSAHITVRARSGRIYSVGCHNGRHGNIVELGPNQQPLARLCVAPGGDIPHFDAILGQIVALQYDELNLRHAANFTPLVANYQRDAA